MAAKRTKFERVVLPPRRTGARRRKTWILTHELAARVEQTASRRLVDESEVVMRAIEQYLPEAATPRRQRKAAGEGEPEAAAA